MRQTCDGIAEEMFKRLVDSDIICEDKLGRTLLREETSATTKETVNSRRLAEVRVQDVGHSLENGDAWKKRTREINNNSILKHSNDGSIRLE